MKRPSIAEIASKRSNAATLQRESSQDDLARFLDEPAPAVAVSPDDTHAPEDDNATAPKRRNVAASKRDSVKPKRGAVLPHDSIYLHPDVRKAIRLHALENDMRLQEVLRLAVKQYLDRKGIKFRDLETGERDSAKAS